MFEKSIQNLIKNLKKSNYPENTFIYSDDFIDLNMGIEPVGLVAMAIHDEDCLQVLREENFISSSYVISIANVAVREQFQRKGYFKNLLKAFRENFPKHYICIPNVFGEQLAKWLMSNSEWRGTLPLMTKQLSDQKYKNSAKDLVEERNRNFVLMDNIK